MIKTIFKIVGFDIKTAEGTFIDSCIFWIYADDAKDAITKAKLYKIKRKEYQVLEVIEKDKEFDVVT